MMDEGRELIEEERVARVLRRRLRDTQLPPFSVIDERVRPRTPLPLVLSAGVAVLLLALIAGSALRDLRQSVGAPSAASPSMAVAPSDKCPDPAFPTHFPWGVPSRGTITGTSGSDRSAIRSSFTAADGTAWTMEIAARTEPDAYPEPSREHVIEGRTVRIWSTWSSRGSTTFGSSEELRAWWREGSARCSYFDLRVSVSALSSAVSRSPTSIEADVLASIASIP